MQESHNGKQDKLKALEEIKKTKKKPTFPQSCEATGDLKISSKLIK